jgi:hypothetical protein
MFKNKVPSKMLGPERKGDTETGNQHQKIFLFQYFSWNSTG